MKFSQDSGEQTGKLCEALRRFSDYADTDYCVLLAGVIRYLCKMLADFLSLPFFIDKCIRQIAIIYCTLNSLSILKDYLLELFQVKTCQYNFGNCVGFLYLLYPFSSTAA